MDKVDITIIGAGVVGLAVSYLLADLEKEIIVVEKDASFGQETSSRNSEVIHAGLYYPKDSIKSEACIHGRGLLYDLCAKHSIPCRKSGKLLVASTKEERAALQNIYQNASDCGVRNLRFLTQREIKEAEPDIEGHTALFSPETGIIDSHSLMAFFCAQAKAGGVGISFSVEVIDIGREGGLYKLTVKEPQGDTFSFLSETVINCAGLMSDKIAQLVGMDIEKNSYKIHYCKGQYFRMSNPEKFSIKHLIYPPPTEVSLGIHITPDLGGGVRFGPDAKYVSAINYDVNEADKKMFFDSLRTRLPALEAEDLIPDTAGIRAKLQGEGEEFRDFVVKEETENGFENFVNLIGIDSPGLTSCLSLAEIVKDIVKKKY